MNDLERVNKYAFHAGGMQYLTPCDTVCVEANEWIMSPEELLAFEQAVLAKRDAEFAEVIIARHDALCDLDEATKEIESLQSKLAIQAEADTCQCGDVGFFVEADNVGEPMQIQCQHCYENPKSRFKALNATQAGVDAFMQGKKLEWEKGVLDWAADNAPEGYGLTWPHMELHDMAFKRR